MTTRKAKRQETIGRVFTEAYFWTRRKRNFSIRRIQYQYSCIDFVLFEKKNYNIIITIISITPDKIKLI